MRWLDQQSAANLDEAEEILKLKIHPKRLDDLSRRGLVGLCRDGIGIGPMTLLRRPRESLTLR
jgi:hypothetical protein